MTADLRSAGRHRGQGFGPISVGGHAERLVGELLDRARAHYLDAARLDHVPVAWSCSVAAGHALLEAAAVVVRRHGEPVEHAGGLVLSLYVERFSCAPWDDHGPGPAAGERGVAAGGVDGGHGVQVAEMLDCVAQAAADRWAAEVRDRPVLGGVQQPTLPLGSAS